MLLASSDITQPVVSLIPATGCVKERNRFDRKDVSLPIGTCRYTNLALTRIRVYNIGNLIHFFFSKNKHAVAVTKGNGAATKGVEWSNRPLTYV
jgi:hypothetical protein